jgi:hypothetical protein
MKSLSMNRDEKKTNITVECATGMVSVYTRCAYCSHFRGIRLGARMYPSPQEKAWKDLKARGGTGEEALMNAALQFNTLVSEGEAIECDDDAGTGYSPLYR